MKSIKTQGRKPILVLLHAFPLSSAMWNAQRQALSRVARVVTPDLPGFGASSSLGARSMEAMARQVAKNLDRLSIHEPVILAGLSMGGYVALEFVRLFPRRVRGLGLFATRAGADNVEQKKKRYMNAKNVQLAGTGELIRGMLAKALGKTTQAHRPRVIRSAKRIMSAQSASGVRSALLAIAKRRDNTAHLKKISCPTLILAGAEDTLIPLDEMRLLKKSIRRSTFFIIPKAGHLLNLEAPALTNQRLVSFIRRFR